MARAVILFEQHFCLWWNSGLTWTQSDLDDQDLAYRFGVSQSTISKVFNKCIEWMYIRLNPLVHWPERDVIQKNHACRVQGKFSQVRMFIIDCFEVFCECPSNLMARAQTYSNYKSHNTAKFLIGIAPQGSIVYISQPWGGCISDKYITEHWITSFLVTNWWQTMASQWVKVLDCIVQS